MKLKIFRFAPLAAVLLAAVFLHGCGYRAEAAPLASNAPAAAETTPAPTETPVFTVEYRLGDDVLKTESIPFDGSPAADAALPEGLYLVAWTDETGRRADPAAPVETDTVYYALARPVLNTGAAFLFPDEYGLLRPESAMTHAECSAALRALGNTRQPLIYLAIAGVLNVIMNLFFVIVVGIDVAGVAIATVLSQCVSGFLTVRCLLTSQELHVKELHFSGHIFKKMMNIGIPAGIQGSLFSISNFIIQASVNSFGAAVIAGNSACVSVEGLLYCPSDAVMQAATTAVSQNVGAQEYERSRSVARWSMVLVVVLTGILTVPAVVFRRQVLGLYTSSGAELEAAFTRMMIVCLTYSLDGTMAAMSGVNRGLGYSMLSAAVTFVGACVFRIIWVYTVFASVGTLESLYVSYPISWILSTAAHIVCYYIIRKKPFKATLEAKTAAA